MAEKRAPREAPISFRPGNQLRAAIRRRADPPTEGQVVKRDLARYYLLLATVPLDERLTRREAIWLNRASWSSAIEEIYSQSPFTPEHREPSEELLAIVNLAARKETLHGGELSEIAQRVLSKVERMTPLEQAALLDALYMLPSHDEEQQYDPAHWAMIGIRLADDPPPTAEPRLDRAGKGDDEET
jgi:hypothetical protein